VATAADKSAGAVIGVIGAVFKVLLTILLIFVTAGLLFTCVFAFYVKTCLTDELDVSLSDFNLSLSSTILYEDDAGDWQELVTLSSDENRIWVDYDSIPKDMEEALVAIEDKRFYEHKGVDWYRTVAALANMFFTMKDDFGGSTITQQLIKNLTQNEDITVQRKLLEIFQALEFEKKYTKEEIMEWYLNAVYFGEGCWGVYTAAQTYFDKDVSELSLAECARRPCRNRSARPYRQGRLRAFPCRMREHHRHHQQPVHVRPLYQHREQQGAAGAGAARDVQSGLYRLCHLHRSRE